MFLLINFTIEIRYKNELKELKNLKDELLADLQRTNKTVSSYQYIQISTLNEIEELKKSLQDAQVCQNHLLIDLMLTYI